MKVELEWRRRAGNVALVLKRCAPPQAELTVYVLDPALENNARRNRHRRLVDAMFRNHTETAQPGYLCLLGSASPPLLAIPDPSSMDRRPAVERLLQNPPAFGRWWSPSRSLIDRWRREFASYRLTIRVLLNHHQLLPIDWDGLPDCGPDVSITVVAEDAIPDGGECSVMSWPEFDARMRRSDTVQPTGYAPRIEITNRPDGALKLAPEASDLGWTMTEENGRTILAHRDFRMPQGDSTITLVIVERGFESLPTLPYAIFD